MRLGRAGWASAGLLLAACQAVGGIDARDIDPRYLAGGTTGSSGKAGASATSGAGAAGSTSGGGGVGGAGASTAGKAGAAAGGAGAAGAAGATSGCPGSVPVTAGVRLANFHLDGAIVDFCATPKGQGFAAAAPLVHVSASCPAGLGYLDVAAPVPLGAGVYDLKAVPAGASCASPGEIVEGVEITKNVITIARVGGAGTPPALIARAERAPGAVTSSEEVRFLHVSPGTGALDFGSTKPSLPSPLTAVIGTGVAFGETLPPTAPGVMPPFGIIDDKGYIGGPGYDIALGVAKAGGATALALINVPKNIYATLFVVGSPTDAARPIQMMLCREDLNVGAFTSCVRSLRKELVFDAFAADLSGIVSPREEERRPYMKTAMAQLTSDVVCLGEVGSQKDKDEIVAAATQFPHSLSFKHDESTPPTDPEDQNGVVPPPPSAPACAAPAQVAQVDALKACAASHCSSIPGSTKGYVTDVDCVTKFCSGEYASLFATKESQNCLLCMQAGVDSYAPIEQFEKRCETVSSRAYSFEGGGSVMLLSKLPFVDGSTASYVLPSTLVRREVVKATVQSSSGPVDVYCGILGEVYTVLVPYSGPYSAGASGPQGWANEQMLQAKKWIAWVEKTSTSERKIIAGQMYGSSEHKNAEGALVVSGTLGAATLALFKQAYDEALTPDYVPACTRCTINPLVNQSVLGESPPGPWLTHIFAKGPAAMRVTSSERIFLENVVPITDSGGPPTLVPISRNYGMRVKISLD